MRGAEHRFAAIWRYIWMEETTSTVAALGATN
jgi:hypothetical protein